MDFDRVVQEDGGEALTIRIGAQELHRLTSKYYEQKLRPAYARERIHARGFRPGRAPRSAIEKYFGGYTQAYADVWIDLIASIVRPLLIFERLRVVRGDPTVVTAVAHPVPPVTLPPDFVPVLYEPWIPSADAQVTEIIRRARERAVSYEGSAGPIGEQHHAVVSVEARTADGAPWEPGVLDRKTLSFGPGDLHPDSMRLSFLGRNAGDRWEQTIVLDEAFGPLHGTEVHQVCTVHTVMLPRYPTDDDLASDLGWQNLGFWKASLARPLVESTARRRTDELVDQLVRQLERAAEIGPVPDLWVDVQVAQRAQLLDQNFPEETKLFEAYGVSDRVELTAKLSAEARASLRRELLIISYGERVGHPVDERSYDLFGKHVPEILESALSVLVVRTNRDSDPPAIA